MEASKQNEHESSGHRDEPRDEPRVTFAADPENGGIVAATVKQNPPRMVLRNLPFHQSKNKFAVDHNQGWSLWKLLRYDWFHVVLNLPTCRSLMALLILWTSMILIFAGFYMRIDRRSAETDCGLGAPPDAIKFGAAFAFSLETCTTVGYGLPSGSNAFFENCRDLQAAIFAQMVWSMLFNAFLFAFMYTRLARSNTRSNQVILSNQAVVSTVGNQVRFQIRVYDVDAEHPVVEAHVRLYVMTRERPVPRPLRLLQPDDDLGGVLFLSMPCVVSHHIDMYSLLHPPRVPLVDPSGLPLRQVDSTTGGRDDYICPVCGESYGTHERWVRHVRYTQLVERKEDYPEKNTHLSISEKLLEEPPDSPIAALRGYFQAEIAEVVAIVEGIDPLSRLHSENCRLFVSYYCRCELSVEIGFCSHSLYYSARKFIQCLEPFRPYSLID